MIVVSSYNVSVNKLSVHIYDMTMTFDLAKRVNNVKYMVAHNNAPFLVPLFLTEEKNRHMKKKLFANKVGNCT
jgi:hypothetical protein